LFDDAELGNGLGTRAAETVRERFSFDLVFEKEDPMVRQLVDE
jgi:hypothetical protein